MPEINAKETLLQIVRMLADSDDVEALSMCIKIKGRKPLGVHYHERNIQQSVDLMTAEAKKLSEGDGVFTEVTT